MAKIAKELRLTDEQMEVWFGRIARAFRARKPHFQRWEVLREFVKGRYYDEWSDENRVAASWHQVNLRQMMSALYHHDPRMNFMGKTRRGVMQALVMERAMSYVRNRIKCSREEKRAIRHGLSYGTGVLKVGWNAEFGEDISWSDDLAKKTKDSVKFDNSPSSDDLKLRSGVLTEHDTRFQTGMPWLKHIPTWDFLIDPEASTIEDARWFAHRFNRPFIDAKNDERWDREARENLQPTGTSKFYTSDDTEERQWYENRELVDSSLVTFYEIFDRNTLTLITLSDSTTKPLMVRPFPYFGKDGPYVIYQPIEADDTPWGQSWLDQFTPQAQAVNEIRTQMLEYLQRLGWPKGVYASSLISENDAQRLAQSRIGEMVPVRVLNGQNVKNFASWLDAPPISSDAWNLSNLFKQDMQEISGITENQLGGGRGVQTATEASIIQQQVSQRQGDMRNSVDNFIEESTRKLMTIMRKFWTGIQILPIVGPDGQIWDFPVDSELINGEFDVGIEVGSTERVDRAARMRQGIELLQVLTQMVPAMAAQGKGVNLAEVVKSILLESEFIKNPDRVLFDIQQPMQPMLPGPGGQQNIQNVPAPNTVNARGQVNGTSEADVRGRIMSEAAA